MYSTLDAQAARLDGYWEKWQSNQIEAENSMKDLQTLRTQYRVSDFVTWQREGTLQLNPNFQRRPVWRKGAKSFLIDTIVRGLPVPIIFLRDLKADLKDFKSGRDIVDGQQRIRTILSYVDPKLLPDFKPDRDEFTLMAVHNSRLGGKSFDQLPDDDRQRILDYQFSVHSFPADTDDREILQIFARMNSTGVKANAQELRNAEFKGWFKTTAYTLAAEQLNRWRDWGIFSPEQIARMNEVELTSEFLVLILNGVMDKNNKTLSNYYKIYDEEFPGRREVESRFRKVFDFIDSQFSGDEIRELFKRRTVFYALFTSIYGLMYEIKMPIDPPTTPKSMKARTIPALVLSHIKNAGRAIKDDKVPPDVGKALRGATSDAGTRRILVRHLTGKEHDPCPGP